MFESTSTVTVVARKFLYSPSHSLASSHCILIISYHILAAVKSAAGLTSRHSSAWSSSWLQCWEGFSSQWPTRRNFVPQAPFSKDIPWKTDVVFAPGGLNKLETVYWLLSVRQKRFVGQHVRILVFPCFLRWMSCVQWCNGANLVAAALYQ